VRARAGSPARARSRAGRPRVGRGRDVLVAVSPQTFTSGREASSASRAAGSGRAHERRADEDRVCTGELGRGALRAGLDARLGDHDAVGGDRAEEGELRPPVDRERREVARVDADDRRPERDRPGDLRGVVRLDERVEPEAGRLLEQRPHQVVVEVAGAGERRVGACLLRRAQVVGRGEEALGEERRLRRGARGPQVVPVPAKRSSTSTEIAAAPARA
jgi:hypothetical protein